MPINEDVLRLAQEIEGVLPGVYEGVDRMHKVNMFCLLGDTIEGLKFEEFDLATRVLQEHGVIDYHGVDILYK